MALRVGSYKGFAIVMKSLMDFMYQEIAKRVKDKKQMIVTVVIQEVEDGS